MSTFDGGPAFPLHTPEWHEKVSEKGYPDTGCDFTMGLSVRDYFAAKAMQGFISEPVEGVKQALFHDLDDKTCALLAKSSYAIADAMLKARES